MRNIQVKKDHLGLLKIKKPNQKSIKDQEQIILKYLHNKQIIFLEILIITNPKKLNKKEMIPKQISNMIWFHSTLIGQLENKN